MKYEILEPGHWYHIYNQGNNKENIFFEERNYAYFLHLLKKYVCPISEIYTYCLLPNHFHFLVKIKEDIEQNKCSQAFSNFFNAYAKAINKSYQRSGSLFKRKFSRIKIKNEAYLKKLVLYIHTNPQYHGLIDKFDDYPYSSYHNYLSEKPTHISKAYILDLFDNKENFKYAHFMKSELPFNQVEDYTLE